MIVADVTNIQCMVKEINRIGEIRWFDGLIQEIYYDVQSKPYQIMITWNGKTKKLIPKFDNGVMTCILKNKSILNIYVYK